MPHRVFFAADGKNFSQTGTVCIGDREKPLSLDAVLAQVHAFVDQLIPPTATLLVQPPGGTTIVNLPTLMRTEDPAVAAKDFFANAGAPVRVHVVVRPASWHWQADRIAVLTTDFGGRAYDPAHSPRREPDYYASHTFDATGPHRLAVTVDWTATATIAGLGDVDVDGTTQRTSPSVPIQVKQARAQLESGG